MIKLNVPLKAIGIEIDTACNFLSSSPLLLLSLFPPPLCLILHRPFSFLNQRKHTLIVRINESPSAVIVFCFLLFGPKYRRQTPLWQKPVVRNLTCLA